MKAHPKCQVMKTAGIHRGPIPNSIRNDRQKRPILKELFEMINFMDPQLPVCLLFVSLGFQTPFISGGMTGRLGFIQKKVETSFFGGVHHNRALSK